MKIRHILFSSILLLSLVFSNVAFGWVQFLAPVGAGVMWLGRLAASNVVMARAVEWSIYTHGAILGFLAWKNSGDAAQTTTPVNARLVVSPNVDAQRDNPDPNRYNDAAAGQRNPTPKSTYSEGSTKPGNGSLSAIVSVGIGSSTYQNADGTMLDTVVLQTYQSGLSQAQAETAVKNATQGSYTGWNWSGGYYIASTDWRAVWYRNRPASCATGYTLTSGVCTLTNSTAVQKPAGKIPCEVIRNANATWEIDAANPECANLVSQLTTSGNSTTYQRAAGDYDTITANPDGSMTVVTRGPNGNRTINLGPWNNSQGGATINSITDDGTGTGTGTGTSTGTGSGGSCGGSGQPACAIDDSGFNGKDASVNSRADAAIAKLDDRITQIQGVNDSNAFGIDTSWIPSLKPGPIASCEALHWSPSVSHGILSGLNGSVDIQWCDKVDVIREYLAWLFGLVTVYAIAMLFFGSNKPGSDK